MQMRWEKKLRMIDWSENKSKKVRSDFGGEEQGLRRESQKVGIAKASPWMMICSEYGMGTFFQYFRIIDEDDANGL